jgi:hypothetical protein
MVIRETLALCNVLGRLFDVLAHASFLLLQFLWLFSGFYEPALAAHEKVFNVLSCDHN